MWPGGAALGLDPMELHALYLLSVMACLAAVVQRAQQQLMHFKAAVVHVHEKWYWRQPKPRCLPVSLSQKPQNVLLAVLSLYKQSSVHAAPTCCACQLPDGAQACAGDGRLEQLGHDAVEHLRPHAQDHTQALQALARVAGAVQAVEQAGHHALHSAVRAALEQHAKGGAGRLAHRRVVVAERALDGWQDVAQVLRELVARHVLQQLRQGRQGGGQCRIQPVPAELTATQQATQQ